jgi:hypothetical protein
VGRIYDEVKGRPLYVVREMRGFAPPPVLEPAAMAEEGERPGQDRHHHADDDPERVD